MRQKKKNGEMEYKVTWVGYTVETWESKDSFKGDGNMLELWEDAKKKAKLQKERAPENIGEGQPGANENGGAATADDAAVKHTGKSATESTGVHQQAPGKPKQTKRQKRQAPPVQTIEEPGSPEEEEEEDEEEEAEEGYVVNKILCDRKTKSGEMEYKVSWVGYTGETWEGKDSFKGDGNMLELWEDAKDKAKTPAKRRRQR